MYYGYNQTPNSKLQTPNSKLQTTFSSLVDQNLADSVKMLKNAYKWLSAPTSGSQRLQVVLQTAYKWLSAPTSGS